MIITSFSKLNKYQGAHSVYNFYKASHLFDPTQLLCISHDINSFTAIKDLQDPFNDLEKFQIYVNYQDDLPNQFNIPAFWNANKNRFPLLEEIANKVTWMPTSINAEHSFPQYKHLQNKQHESLTPENTKLVTMLYYNGDLEKIWRLLIS